MKEEWREIKGFEGRYQVSNLGQVRSYISMCNGRRKMKSYHRILRHSISRGYHRVCLIDEKGRRIMQSVHRLVAFAFIGDCTDFEINHKDGNKANNKVTNLEICDQSYNTIHAYKLGLMKPCNNGLWKKIKAFKDGEMIGSFDSIRLMCRELKLNRNSVNKVIKGENISYHGLTFEVA